MSASKTLQIIVEGAPQVDVPRRKRRTARERAAAPLETEAARLAEKQAKHLAVAAAIGADIQALRDQIDALMGHGQAHSPEAA